MRYALILALLSTPAFGVVPVLTDWTGTPDTNNGGQSISTAMTIHVPLNRAAAAGNTIVVWFRYTTGTVFTVSDGGDTFTRGVHGTGNGWTLDSYYAVNIAQTPTVITITHTTASMPWFSAVAMVFDNVTAHNANSTCATGAGNGVDQTSSTTAASGSITPANGDLVVYYTFTETGPQQTTAYAPVTHANITWTPIANEIQNSQAAMYGQYTSTSAFAPSMTQGVAGTLDYSACSMSFTSGTSGSGIPAGTQIVGQQTETLQNGLANPTTIAFTSHGDTILGLLPTGGNMAVSGITSSPSKTWTIGAACTDSTVATTSQAIYVTGLSAGTTYTLTITLTNVVSDAGISLFDIVNGGAFDTGTQGGCNTGNFSAVSGVLDTSLTTGGGAASNKTFGPSTANGIIFSTISNAFATVSATTTTGALLANGFFSGATQTGNTFYYNNDGLQTIVTSSMTALPVKYTYTSSPPNTSTDVANWAAVTVMVEAPAVASNHVQNITGIAQ